MTGMPVVMPAQPGSVGVVIVTRNRRRQLIMTLARLRALPEAPPVVVVDNASTDDTADAIRMIGDVGVTLVRCERNAGAAARNAGVKLLATELVAFCDDDSWFVAGALARAKEHFASHPRLGLLAASVVLDRTRRIDPTTRAMRSSPLGTRPGQPGPDVLGFVACGAVVRRRAFLDAGGFEARFGIGSEETLLALDLVAAGWEAVHAPDVVAIHQPAEGGARPGRRRAALRNDLWTDWLRQPPRAALASTARAVGMAMRSRELAPAPVLALAGLPWVLRKRRPVLARLHERWQAVRASSGSSTA